MPLYRRRESVTALNIIEHLKAQHGSTRDNQIIRLVVDEIERALTEICSRNGIVEQ